MVKYMSKYDFTVKQVDSKIDYTELVTVPDQVLSMKEIYEKYAVTRDISGLSSGFRPRVTDNFDLDDPELDFEYEEPVDILQRSRALRMAAETKVSVPANPAAEDKPVGEAVNKEDDSLPAKQEEPAASPDANPAS